MKFGVDLKPVGSKDEQLVARIPIEVAAQKELGITFQRDPEISTKRSSLTAEFVQRNAPAIAAPYEQVCLPVSVDISGSA